MTMIKRGTCSSISVISSSVYACSCGHTEIITSENPDVEKKCPKCGEIMRIISTACESKPEENIEK